MTTREEWLGLVEREEGVTFITALVDAVLGRTKEVLFEKEIQKKMLPFAAAFAKDTMLGMVKWRFYQRDPGELDPAIWVMDREPDPVAPDCLARAAIPLVVSPPKSLLTAAGATTAAATATNPGTTATRSADLLRSSLPTAAKGTPATNAIPTPALGQSRVDLLPSHRGSAAGSAVAPAATAATGQVSRRVSLKGNSLLTAPHGGADPMGTTSTGPGNAMLGSASRRTSLHPITAGGKSSVHGAGIPHEDASTPSSPLPASAFLSERRKSTAAPRPANAHTLAILEENARTLERITAAAEKEGAGAFGGGRGKEPPAPVDLYYDHEGKVGAVKRLAPSKYGLHGVKARVVPSDADAAEGGEQKHRSRASKHPSTLSLSRKPRAPTLTPLKGGKGGTGPTGAGPTGAASTSSNAEPLLPVYVAGGEVRMMGKQAFYDVPALPAALPASGSIGPLVTDGVVGSKTSNLSLSPATLARAGGRSGRGSKQS